MFDSLEEEYQVAQRIGKKAARSWPVVEAEDVVSELFLWLVEHKHVVDRYRSEEHGKAKLITALTREANKYCADEHVARTGVALDAGMNYSTSQIERALPFIFEQTPQHVVAVNPVTGQAVGNAGPSSDALAIVLDIRAAFEDLPADMREVVTMRFRDELTFREIAALVGLSDVGAMKRCERAIARIQATLG